MLLAAAGNAGRSTPLITASLSCPAKGTMLLAVVVVSPPVVKLIAVEGSIVGLGDEANYGTKLCGS